MRIKTYDFVGESDYINAVDDIRKYLCFLLDDDYAYDMAINEAVLNAAQYSIDGPDNAKIHLEISFTAYDVSTKVCCETKSCDMLAYREQLRSIAARPENKGMDWADYVADSDGSRGLWYMLGGTEYIIMGHQAQYVCLCTKNPFPRERETKKMQDLLMRFFVEKDGVLL